MTAGLLSMSVGAALVRLLRRPAALAWLPLAALASLAAMVLQYVLLALFDIVPRQNQLAVIDLTLAAWIGVLVGQSMKELQHCGFSWGLPRLRTRLLPGAMAVAAFVALFAREIFALTAWLALIVPMGLFGGQTGFASFWQSLPGLSPAMLALTFLAFWIGVRPSAVNLVGVVAPMFVLSPWITSLTPSGSILIALATAPLTLFLIVDTFSVAAARRRPFVPTCTLSGAPWGRNAARERPAIFRRATRRRARSSRWPSRPLGPSVGRWILAGWHENHGASGRVAALLFLLLPCAAALLFVGMIVETMFESPALWFATGYGQISLLPGSVHLSIVSIVVGSMIVGVPLATFCAAYGSISLRCIGLYPLSRRRRATIEYWSSLAETLVVAGFAGAVLMGLWAVLVFVDYGRSGFDSWPPQAGSDYGWVLALMRSVAFLLIVTPTAQYYRLRDIRSPSSGSPVVRLLTVMLLAALLTALGIAFALGSLDALADYALALHAAIFVTAAAVAQYGYRHAIERYFATADLV